MEVKITERRHRDCENKCLIHCLANLYGIYETKVYDIYNKSKNREKELIKRSRDKYNVDIIPVRKPLCNLIMPSGYHIRVGKRKATNYRSHACIYKDNVLVYDPIGREYDASFAGLMPNLVDYYYVFNNIFIDDSDL